MKKIIAKIRRIFEIDKYVTEARKNEIFRTQQIVALIAAVGFAIMSIMNIIQSSTVMLITTGSAAIIFALGYFVSLFTRSAHFLKAVFYVTILLLFPVYTVVGGNEGFAVLWMLLVTYLVMYVVDYQIGAYICMLHLLFLCAVFLTPLSSLLLYDYSDTFMLRFPALYLVNYAFSCYICGTMRVYQYRIILEQRKYREMSIRDLLTGAYNRNAYMTFISEFTPDKAKLGTVVYMDANGLHELNNSKGHSAGDDLLRSVVEVSKSVFPLGDVYRVGGDEFVIFLRDMDGKAVAERIPDIHSGMAKKSYSVSVGTVSFVSDSNTNLSDVTSEANRIMLENKAKFYSDMSNDRRSR